MRLNKVTIFVLILIFVVGGIGLSLMLNVWDTAPGKGMQQAIVGDSGINQAATESAGETTATTSVPILYNPGKYEGLILLPRSAKCFIYL